MTPRETRAWLAKYVLGKGDLSRLAEHLCVAATPAAVVGGRYRPPSSAFPALRRSR